MGFKKNNPTHDTTTLLWLFAYVFSNKICVTHSHFLKDESACWEFAFLSKIDSVLIFVSLSLPPVKNVFFFLFPHLNVPASWSRTMYVQSLTLHEPTSMICDINNLESLFNIQHTCGNLKPPCTFTKNGLYSEGGDMIKVLQWHIFAQS